MKTPKLKLSFASIIFLISTVSVAQQKDKDAEIERLKEELTATLIRVKMAEEFAIKCKKEAEKSYERANIAEKSAVRCRYILMAKMQASKSLELDDSPELQAMVAQLACKFYTRNLGSQPDNDIYKGLYHSLERLNDPIIKQLENLTWQDKVVAMSKSLCGHIKRNMNKEEWNNFVGSDLPYESICEGLPLNNK